MLALAKSGKFGESNASNEVADILQVRFPLIKFVPKNTHTSGML